MKSEKFPQLLALLLTGMLLFPFSANAQILLKDNGPIINSVGSGFGGADESILQSVILGMATYGFGHQVLNSNRVGDDFVVPDTCGWFIDSIVFFAYQTGSSTSSTINHVNFRIWDDLPDTSGSVIIFGDTTTNRMINSDWTGVYRVLESATGLSDRPIMKNTVNLNGFFISQGSFWMDWQSSGLLASGPWAPPIAILGQPITGNGIQSVNQFIWNTVVDGGTNTPRQGFPFKIYGRTGTPIVNAGSPINICPQGSTTIGGSPTATSGHPPYTYSWSPTVGLSATNIANPVASPIGTTSYQVVVTDSHGCVDSATVEITVSNSGSATFLGADTSICDGSTYTLSPGTFNSYNWSTTATSPTIAVTTAGVVWVSVQDSNGCTQVDTVTIGIQALATSAFSFSNSGLSYTFTNLSSNATSYNWTFGDGNSDTSTDPMHTYSIAGSYDVTLIATNPCGSDTLVQNITISGLQEAVASDNILIYPNPASNKLNIEVAGIFEDIMIVKLYNLLGAEVKMEEMKQGGSGIKAILNISNLPKGSYMLKIGTGANSYWQQVIIQ